MFSRQNKLGETHMLGQVAKKHAEPCGLQQDGDLLANNWEAICKVGATSLKVPNVKGHATYEDISDGESTMEHDIGNEEADELADRGSEEHAGSLFSKPALLD